MSKGWRKPFDEQEFIAKAKIVHGNSYDYSHLNYDYERKTVELTCNKHNFISRQSVGKHLIGNRPCKFCSKRGLDQEDFLFLMNEAVGNRYDFEKSVYKGWTKKITVLCPEHGEFSTIPKAIYEGVVSCSYCNGQKPIDREEFIRRVIEKQGDIYDFQKVPKFGKGGIHRDVTVSCKKHNKEFVIDAWVLIRGAHPCVLCVQQGRKYTEESFLQRAKDVHSEGKYDYSLINFGNVDCKTKVPIICSFHPEKPFLQTIDGHIAGKEGCPQCDKTNRLTTFEEFKKRVEDLHGINKYSFEKTVLHHGVQGIATLTCLKHKKDFEYPFFDILQGREGCVDCRPPINQSQPETELGDFVESLGFRIERRVRGVIGRKELDIYLPEENLAIEFNGIYWHQYRKEGDDTKHYEKWKECQDRGIRLLTVWEDDWSFKQDIVKEHIRQILKISERERIFARNCFVKEVEGFEARNFLNSHHIQGSSNSSVYLGIFKKITNELVSVSAFRKNKENYYLDRYATSKNVIGGHSKVISYFEKNFEYENLITFADLSFSDGDLYKKTGWILDKIIEPDYSYLVGGKRKHKFGYRIKRFKNDPDLIFEEGLTETELSKLNGIQRIYDCGKIRFVKPHSNLISE